MYRQPHVRCTELCLDSAIGKLNRGMHNRLRMNEHLDLLHRHAEEPFGFDDFKTFVHHRGGVDRDLRAHLPIRVFECVSCGNGLHLLTGKRTERSAGSGQEDLLNLRPVFAYKRLEDRGMFAIYGEYRRVVLKCQLADNLSCHNERFFVREGNGLTGFDRFYCGSQTGITDHRSDHDIYRTHRHHFRYRVRAGPYLAFKVDSRELIAESFVQALISDADYLRMKLLRLSDQQVNTSVCAKRIDSVTLRISANNI